MNTKRDIRLKAMGMFSSLRYLRALSVRCTMSALDISPAITSISLSNPVKLNGILKMRKMCVVIMHEAGAPPPLYAGHS